MTIVPPKMLNPSRQAAFVTAGPLPPAERARAVTAVLGPTNTGKTHLAIDRMLGHATGIIGLPLRLLAREVYQRIVERVGPNEVALITGEEKIKPHRPRYWVSTVEAMPRDLDVSFVAIDEIQLAADLDRGHIFTDRLLNRRGRDETLILGAGTMRRAIEQLLPGATIVTRPRLSNLGFAGEKKLTRLPRRSAIVAFSAEEVYAIAELIRRQRGGAAVVLGALSPRTRNAQVALYQDGDVDYIVATDAIGMGLNLDIDHVAFAGNRKFDGWHYRQLNPAEYGQIAGRAGRHVRDGTFGTTGRCPPFDEDLVAALEDHRFDPVPILQWRNSTLDFSTIAALQQSLDALPDEPGLARAPLGEDVLILDIVARDEAVQRATKTGADVRRLWDVCQIPDYRKVSPGAHAELALTLYNFIVRANRIPQDWFSRQLALFDRADGDIDALSARIAQVRTWTYVANRSDWLHDPEHWQGVTRQVEDKLSDALHERLAQRFVDRRTSVLMRRLRENAMLEAEVTPTGDVMVEGQHVGQLQGFRFTPDPQATGEAARALNAAAQKSLASEIEARAARVHEAVDEAFVLTNDGTLRWLGEAVGKLTPGERMLAPLARVLADDQLTGPSLEMVQRRVELWLAQHIKKLLGPLLDLETGAGLDGLARGIGFQIAEALGVLDRSVIANELKSLDQGARAVLRKLGVRFGAFHVYLTQLLKPAPRSLAAQLWALKNSGAEPIKGLDEVPHLAASGRTSFKADKDIPKGLYRAAGFRVCGERAVRVDILERLADLIRPAINYRPGVTPGAPPNGAADRDGFVVTVAMTSLAGCSGEDFASILRALGYVAEQRKGPAITVALIPAASVEPLKPLVETAATGPDEMRSGDADPAPETETPPEHAPVTDPSDDPTVPEPPIKEPAHEDTPLDEPSEDAPVSEPPGEQAPLRQAAPVQADPVLEATATPVPDADIVPVEAAAPDLQATAAIAERVADGDGADMAEAAPPESSGQAATADATTVEGVVVEPITVEAMAVEAMAVEEPPIEVWHPRRRHQPAAARKPDRRPREQGRRHQQPQTSAPPAAGGQAEIGKAEIGKVDVGQPDMGHVDIGQTDIAAAPGAPASPNGRADAPREGRRPPRDRGRRPSRQGRSDAPHTPDAANPDRGGRDHGSGSHRASSSHGPNPQAQGRGPQGQGSQGHGSQGHGSQGHGSQGHGSQGHGSQGHGQRQRFDGPRRDNRPAQGDRSFTSSERPRAERPPDMNSPFAKLLALKAELESNARDKGKGKGGGSGSPKDR